MTPQENSGTPNANDDKIADRNEEYHFSPDKFSQPARPMHRPEVSSDPIPPTVTRNYTLREPEEKPVEPVVHSYDVSGSRGNDAQPAEKAAPQPTTVYAPQQPAVPVKEPVNAGLIVLQWLTYAFWGWTVLALSILTTSVVADFIDGNGSNWFSSYGIAAVLVLLPISYICDSFYAKKEPVKKAGAETVVMVIHAVIFALFGIGALIAAVISLVALFTSSNDSKGAQVALISSLIIAVFYGATFLRTLNPSAIRWLQYKYKLIMLLAVGVIALFGIIGPVANERATRTDRLIETELPLLTESINSYARSEDRLPDSLDGLDLRGDTRKLVDQKLVEYKPESVASTVPRTTSTYLDKRSNITATLDSLSAEQPVFRYQLCVVYQEESEQRGYGYGYGGSPEDKDGYSSYISAYSHPEGRVCYKLKTSEY